MTEMSLPSPQPPYDSNNPRLDAARYNKRTGELPSKGRLEQYLGGYVSADFTQTKREVNEPTTRPGADTQIAENPQKCTMHYSHKLFYALSLPKEWTRIYVQLDL